MTIVTVITLAGARVCAHRPKDGFISGTTF